MFTFFQVEFQKPCVTPIFYTDFQKAFDKVPHKRLIKKIENYGITNPILSWIQDFLTRRYQQVSINKETSNRKEVTSGIPPLVQRLRPFIYDL
jgi:hypothetical protein